jgi:hypothetical protein
MEIWGIEKQNPMLEISRVLLHLHISTKMSPYMHELCTKYMVLVNHV